jgi:hypothetical protein
LLDSFSLERSLEAALIGRLSSCGIRRPAFFSPKFSTRSWKTLWKRVDADA